MLAWLMRIQNYDFEFFLVKAFQQLYLVPINYRLRKDISIP